MLAMKGMSRYDLSNRLRVSHFVFQIQTAE